MSESTLERNFAALDAISVHQRVLRDVDSIKLSANWFGQPSALPIALGPIGIAGMNARRGEVQAARAAQAARIPFCLSTVSICSIEEVAATGQSFWFQLYIMRDRSFMRDLLDRAEAAGCSALILTVDMPQPGKRYRDYRSGLAGASGWGGALRRMMQAITRPRWAWDVGLWGAPHTLGNLDAILEGNSGLEDFLAWMNSNFDPTVTWKDVEQIRNLWSGPLILKGIMDGSDAFTASKVGADAIVLSNHGGRQLDGAKSPAEVIDEIANRLAGQMILFADGGVRSGLDVIRLLALGADGVWLGRAWAYALAAGGEHTVARMLDLFEQEIRITMALCGVTSIAEIDHTIIENGSNVLACIS